MKYARCDDRKYKEKYLNGERHSMAVGADGRVSWTKDYWRLDKMTRPTWYEMPLRALMPERAENLICAGRMVDCERGAYGALRVMVNCNQMGEATARHVAGMLKLAGTGPESRG